MNQLVKKYELTTETIVHFGRTLFRIKALVSFGNVNAGELGGYIEKEENLDQSGNAWVSGDVWVYGDARVSGDARVYGNAEILKPTHLFQLGCIGSRDGFTTFFRVKTKRIHVVCGCFFGDVDEFEKAVTNTHAGTKHEKTYKLAIELAKAQIDDVEI